MNSSMTAEGAMMIRLRESATVEFKRQLNDAVKREIIAFANTEGGDLYIGIDDDGTPVGVDDPDGTMGAVGDMIRNTIKPDLTAYTTIACDSMEDMDGTERSVVHVTVLRGTKQPYYLSAKGLRPTGIFIRHGVSAVPAGEERIRQMIREADGTSFDAAVSIDQDLTFNYAVNVFQRQHLAWGEAQQRSLGMINEDGLYTNAAALLSDQCRHSVKCAVYQGTTKSRFLARQEFRGSLLQQLDEASRYLELNNPVRSEIVGLYRNDSYAYPPSALREALLNAVAHRDYDYSGPTLISVFADRMEFVSLGGLVKGITLTDLTNGISQPRNRTLADILYRLELIESYGSGIPKIMEEYEGNGMAPTIRITPGAFTLSLPRLDDHPDSPGGLTSTNGGAPPRIGDRRTSRDLFPAGPPIHIEGDVQTAVLAGYPTGKDVQTLALAPAAHTPATITLNRINDETDGAAAPLPQASSTLEEVTLALITESQSGMSRMEVQQRLGINKNRAAYVLRKLEHEGSIVATGNARSTRYVAA
ncbi:putative DNA binding domain-containing protein [Bifidobacterium amazonense]|uniref:DNA binding domain-containing protein n=1 Tax=Bifidobacterium amazonense TaxID=2809027 RepID=A0ABS9VYJ3_9BIFI|nr:ATP-binding protein [Bifidobacterium amazonense]MCH9276986.1 putative DNA binding domain-containing protein [Bifidobacterium amazonense]